MFVTRGICKLAALPFLWLGQLAGALGISGCVPLLKLAWSINGEGYTALLALIRMQKHLGPEIARAHAAAWMDKHPRPEIAVIAGELASRADDLEEARRYLARGRAAGEDRRGLLELLEVILACRDPSPDTMANLAERLADRRDLAPVVKRAVLGELLWRDMLAERFEEARERAEFLLVVEEDLSANMALWALCRREGNEAEAERYLNRSSGAPGQRLYYQCLGNLAIGRREEAETMVEQVREKRPELAQMAERYLARKERAG